MEFEWDPAKTAGIFARKLNQMREPDTSHPAFVAVEMNMQPGTEAKSISLAKLGEPDAARVQHFRCYAFRHQDYLVRRCFQLCDHGAHFGNIPLLRDYELELVIVAGHEPPENVRLQPQSFMMR